MLVLTVLGYKKFSLECTDIKIYRVIKKDFLSW
jgi:hypothetical protein